MKQTNVKMKIIILLSVAGILCIAFFIVVQIFTIKNVTIEGNEHYTEEELENLFFTNRYTQNSLYLYWLYHYGEPPSIPFVDTIEVEITKANSVSITVYEKSIVGYVNYLDTCMYFDKDGIVVESTKEVLENVPLITGLQFDHIVLHEKLPIEEESLFQTILTLAQLMSKYEIYPDRIYFDDDDYMTLFFDQVRVYLGADENTEDKVMQLESILPDLEGLSGVLHMEDYSEDDTNITFEKDK